MILNRKRIVYLSRFFRTIIGLFILYFIINSIRIYWYSFKYFEDKSDVAIVLGAGTNNGVVSPIFKERLNHGIYLYKNNRVGKLILTGGFGEGQLQSDSRIAMIYAIKNGVPADKVIIEEKSKYTVENLIQSKLLMDSLNADDALLVSDPMHMLRAITIANHHQLKCKTSPTKSSMYKSKFIVFKQLLYEAFYFSLREPICLFQSLKINSST